MLGQVTSDLIFLLIHKKVYHIYIYGQYNIDNIQKEFKFVHLNFEKTEVNFLRERFMVNKFAIRDR